MSAQCLLNWTLCFLKTNRKIIITSNMNTMYAVINSYKKQR